MMPTPFALAVWFVALAGALPAAPQLDKTGGAPAAQNPYGFVPFHQDFPVELTFPSVGGATYDRTRRQILERLAANLQGNVRREAWQMAMEFFWRAPEDAVDPLIAAMDRAFGNAALGDVVKNTVEAMGKMADPRLEGALLRAIEHKNPVVRQAAFASLAASSSDAGLRAMYVWFPHMDARARTGWMAAVRKRLGADGVALLRAVMMADYPSQVRDEVLKEALLLPAAQAAEVLRGRWESASGEFKAIVAGVLHAAGDARGTVWLQEAMQGEDLMRLGLAIRHATFGDVGVLRVPLLRASAHLRPEIRLEAAKALRTVEGDDVADAYEVLAIPDEVWEVKAIALRELTRRGRGKVMGALLEDLPTATGVRLQLLLQQLAESGDPRAIPVLLARYEKAPAEERRPFLQAMAQNRSDAAIDALIALFAGPDQVVARGHDFAYTTMNYIPTLLLNARGAEQRVLAGFERLPLQDWKRRAALCPTLVGFAADATSAVDKERFTAPVRRILFDSKELPQLRLLALNLLSARWLTVDDALRLKKVSDNEEAPMRALFHDFLNDFF